MNNTSKKNISKKSKSNNLDVHKFQGIKKDQKRKNIFFLEFAVKPNSPKNRIFRDYGGILRINIQKAPHRGKANKAIITLLSKKLNISKSTIRLVAGRTSSTKIFQITTNILTEKDFEKKLLCN